MLITITEPTGLAVTVKEAKDHLRVSGHYDDVYIAGLVGAAIKSVEQRTGFKLFTQIVEFQLDGFTRARTIKIPCGHVTAIDSIKYDDTDDAEQTFDAANYWAALGSSPARVTYKANAWPSTESGKPASVRIRMTAGWADRHDIPDHFKIAIKLLVGNWYENREEAVIGTIATTLPEGVDAILLGNPEYSYYFLADQE